MKYIEVDRVLELISNEVINCEAHFLDKEWSVMPSFKERQEVVDRLRVTRDYDIASDTIFFGSKHKPKNPADKVLRYNYLVLDPQISRSADGTKYTDILWKVKGYPSFGKLALAVMENEVSSLSKFYVFLEDEGNYKEFQPRYSLRRNGKAIYVSAFEFMVADEKMDDMWPCFELALQCFELVGLCEIKHHSSSEFYCYSAQCLDEVFDILFLNRCQELADKETNREEIGHVFFEKQLYPYKIINDVKVASCWVELFAPDNYERLIYDVDRHEFIKVGADYEYHSFSWGSDIVENIGK